MSWFWAAVTRDCAPRSARESAAQASLLSSARHLNSALETADTHAISDA